METNGSNLVQFKRYDTAFSGAPPSLRDYKGYARCRRCGAELKDPARVWVGLDRSLDRFELYCPACLSAVVQGEG